MSVNLRNSIYYLMVMNSTLSSLESSMDIKDFGERPGRKKNDITKYYEIRMAPVCTIDHSQRLNNGKSLGTAAVSSCGQS